MAEKPIIILGAGATKACGGPLTDEILPAAVKGKMAHDDRKTEVWEGENLVKARRAIEYAMFAVIEATLRRIPSSKEFHTKLLEPLYKRGAEVSVMSLNYDVIVDNAMFRLG